jgi:hypothetical protein
LPNPVRRAAQYSSRNRRISVGDLIRNNPFRSGCCDDH